MNLRFFIDRPVFSGVISVVIVLMGVIAMKALPVEQYPDTIIIIGIRNTGEISKQSKQDMILFLCFDFIMIQSPYFLRNDLERMPQALRQEIKQQNLR